MSLSREQALDLFRSDDLLAIAMEADAVRKRLHPASVINYQIDRNINYTNFCTEYCSFCAFYRLMGSAEGYIQTHESIYPIINVSTTLGRNVNLTHDVLPL